MSRGSRGSQAIPRKLENNSKPTTGTSKSRSRGPSPGAIAERTAHDEWQVGTTGRRNRGSLLATAYGQLETIIELCEQLDGYPRHLSLHNGGMLITREPLIDMVPIEFATSGVRVCQFNKDDVEALGLIKFDILGLRTLSIVDESVAMIRRSRTSICRSMISLSTIRRLRLYLHFENDRRFPDRKPGPMAFAPASATSNLWRSHHSDRALSPRPVAGRHG